MKQISPKDAHGYSRQEDLPEGHRERMQKTFQVPDQSVEDKAQTEFLRTGQRPDNVRQGAGMGYQQSPLTNKLPQNGK